MCHLKSRVDLYKGGLNSLKSTAGLVFAKSLSGTLHLPSSAKHTTHSFQSKKYCTNRRTGTNRRVPPVPGRGRRPQGHLTFYLGVGPNWEDLGKKVENSKNAGETCICTFRPLPLLTGRRRCPHAHLQPQPLAMAGNDAALGVGKGHRAVVRWPSE